MIAKETRLRAGASVAVAASLVMGFAVATPASAQETSARSIDVITVTARRQDESLQTVPVTVTAVSGQQLDRFNYDKVADLVARIPSLNVQVGGSGSGGQLSLRGLGSSNISAAFDSAIAFDFDGVQVSTMRIVQSAFFDLAQIEVLKGPQSLFFGKSASAGVIALKSANPTKELEYGGRLAYEFEEQGITAEAFVSGPISEKAGFRLAARFNDINKVAVNDAPAFNRKRGEQNVNIRATLQMNPTDTFDANLKLNYVSQENDGAARYVLQNCGADGVADPVFKPVGFLYEDPSFDAGYDCNNKGKTIFMPDGASEISQQAQNLDVNGGVPYGESGIFFGRLEWNWDITDALTLTSVTGLLTLDAQDSEFYSYGGVKDDGSPAGLGNGLTDHQLEQWTQELRLASSYEGRFNFLLGAFFEKREIEFNTNQQALNISLLAPDSVTGNTTDWYKTHHYDNEAFSIFGQVMIDITDDLELSGGVRYTDEKKVNVLKIPYMHETLVGFGFIPSGFDSGDILFEDDNWSPEVTLSYQAAENINLYASYKTGFKSGGIDNSALPSRSLLCFTDPDEAVRLECADGLIYDSETAKGGEIGAKMQFADRRVTVNTSAFYYVFEDMQIQNFDAATTQYDTTNAGEVTSKGIDVDFTWLTNVEGLTLFASMVYLDTKFTESFDPDVSAGDPTNLKGRSTARAPKFAGNLGIDYRTPVGNGLELGFSGNVAYSSSYFTNEDSLVDHKQGSYALFDLAASIGDIDGRWEVAIVGKNVGDKRVVSTSGGRPFRGAGDDEVYNLNRGRQIFLEGSVHF
jgi:iron complex outermembrane receptor protein